MPLEAFEVNFDRGIELDSNDVAGFSAGSGGAAKEHAIDVFRSMDDALSVEEAHGQVEVVTGRPHGDG